ncbi:serine/threonine-protein kinase [Nannocystis sp.]|uniref:serine/threonine-protein kinase n=1 Tax=Nannocystis sp. TaxID=1962667 RepID=UPI0025D6B8BB|nr:serine/threonine-protein kinase [Nannocystis sp.]
MAELEGDTVLGRYVLGERLAAGSLGTVVAATDPRTGRAVAVKFFDGANDNYAAWVDEMRLALRLVHPHIVPCLDVGHDAGFGLSVLVFPRAMGGSLRRALASGRRFTEEEVRGLLLAMAAALDHAHAHGVVHRDVKPENILALTQVGEPPWALTDFGAGRFLARGAALRSLAGSLPYMAPEVALGVADAASDQYSLGVVALELLLGARPELAGRSAFRLQPGCASGLMAVVARLLDPDPGRRFPGCEALVLALAGLPGAFDVGRTADGAMHLLAGGEVLRVCRETSRLAPVCRVTRGRRFIHEADEATAIVACDRRIVGLDGRATTLLAVEDDLLGFVASRRRGAAWLLRGERLVVSDLAGGQAGARVPLPDEWRPLLGPDAPLTGVTLDHEAALLGLHGAHTLLLVARVGAGVRVQVLRAPAPVYALVRRDEAALIVCGDERGAALLGLVADGLTVIDHGPLPVDCYAVTPGPGPARLRRLIVEDAEDGEAGDG